MLYLHLAFPCHFRAVTLSYTCLLLPRFMPLLCPFILSSLEKATCSSLCVSVQDQQMLKCMPSVCLSCNQSMQEHALPHIWCGDQPNVCHDHLVIALIWFPARALHLYFSMLLLSILTFWHSNRSNRDNVHQNIKLLEHLGRNVGFLSQSVCICPCLFVSALHASFLCSDNLDHLLFWYPNSIVPSNPFS